jgi:hypothetical protein
MEIDGGSQRYDLPIGLIVIVPYQYNNYHLKSQNLDPPEPDPCGKGLSITASGGVAGLVTVTIMLQNPTLGCDASINWMGCWTAVVNYNYTARG